MAEHKKYNINEASRQELAQIPGVDDSKAEAIIEFRERRGWIHNLEELADLGQIEAKDMDQLRQWLTVASERSGSLEYQGKEEEPDIV
jgi:competence protein ComEA